ncbi:MAG: DHH family phosphoesterase [Candidatus Woesearchaeota archaeon]|jgi:hypothetical protein|nr:DHH family phosphoesterase [Candidatus Woesearchaeota archaeon]MDP7181604.1 DHH family phosphoesterase [Candidatus Woesearchaeota archaeon]MDP7198928.1 DHH family phosphoesterase [Candidatus Woesearchaeota archaeon]MDP7467307.1 DHH family phosphoesterase [Candidatus Woesearchaeota archaeon]MDP7647923.1 DHH family phosphoesterase [Candidatus Woesearchaeota archaeon]
MLTKPEIAELGKIIDAAERPFVFFHDDPDGLASFLLLYRKIQVGKGYPLKAAPQLTMDYARLTADYGADTVIILDIAMADQDFLDALHLPTVWVDHHQLQKPKNVLYLNPQVRKKNIPTPALLWPLARKEDLWIATVGCVGDWHVPSFAKECKKQYPYLFGKKMTVQDLLFNSNLGILARVFSFCLKGSTSDVNTNVKIFTRIQDPKEILEQTTPQGKYIWRYYSKINVHYEKLREEALKSVKDDPLLVFTYGDDKLSLTKDLANELLALHPDKIIVLGRRKSGEVRCSLRSGPKINVRDKLMNALTKVDGRGGGHEQACGCAIKEDDFERFLDELR